MSPTNSSSKELQALLDAAVDAVILTDHRGLIEVFNRSAERLFGYSEEETVGRNVSMLMRTDDRDQHDAYLDRYARTQVPHIIGLGRDVVARRKDGSVFQAFLSVGRIADTSPPRFVGFVQDISPRQQALAELKRERDRANRYLEAAQTILLALDLERRVTMINRKGCEVLGQDEAAVRGVDWFETVVPPDQRAHARAHFDGLIQSLAREPLHWEHPIVTRDGSRRVIAWRSVAIADEQDTIAGILCSGDDVTDSRRAEREMREAAERMMQVSRLATVGEMASGISHEINQPLAAIANYAQASTRLLAQSNPDLPEISEALEQIAEQALRAGEIIRRLRTVARNRDSTREPANLNEIITELEPLYRADARSDGVRVRLELAPELPRARLDRVQIQQVVLNLLRNAIDALHSTPANEREVVVRTTSSDHGGVQLAVIDTGPGVSEDMRERLFVPFATNKVHGTGLGLAISRTIVEAHRGRLEYQRSQPHGATFVVTLPGQGPLGS